MNAMSSRIFQQTEFVKFKLAINAKNSTNEYQLSLPELNYYCYACIY